MLLHAHSKQPSVQGQRKPLCWRSLERRARSPDKKAQVPPRGDLGELLAYLLLLLSACPPAVPLPLLWLLGGLNAPSRSRPLGHVTIAPYSLALCKRKGRAPRGTRLPRLTSHYYILIDRRTLLTRLVVPAAWKISSVLNLVPRCLKRFHRVMTSSAGGAGPLSGGTAL